MAKKSNKKTKQVASRAKTSRKDIEQKIAVATEAITALENELSGDDDGEVHVSTKQLPIQPPDIYAAHGIEFGVESSEETRKNAITRAKKVDLKTNIRQIVATFSKNIDAQLQELSQQVENQLKPLVDVVATIAVAKNDLATKLADFEESLSVTLSLNDELEPIEIEAMFSPDTAMDSEMSTYGDSFPPTTDEDTELLAEATEDARQQETRPN